MIISTNLGKILNTSNRNHRKREKNFICILFEKEFCCFKTTTSRSGNHYLLYILSTITIICSTILCHKSTVPKSSMRAQLNFYQRPPVVTYDEDRLVDNAKHKPSNGNDNNNNHRDESNLISDLDVPTANAKELRDMKSRNGTTNDANLVVNNQPVQVMFNQDYYYDDDDDDDDDNEDDDFEDDFYVENPLDLIKKTNELDYGKDIPVKESDFRDVYGRPTSVKTHPNKKSNSSQKRKRGKRKRRRRRKLPKRFNNGTYEPKTSSSGADGLSGGYGAESCAAVLARGVCITYQMVEWAIRVAKRILSFQQPGGLNSLEPSEYAIHSIGELNELVTRILANRFHLTWTEIGFELEQIDMSQTSAWRNCPALFRSPPNCLALSRYRTHTGQCNNLLGPHLGSTNMPFVRILPAQYDDAVGLPRTLSTISRVPLPPVRLLAINLHPDVGNPSQEHSALFASWGQLLNHDMAMASGARDATGHGKPCCPEWRSRICMPIEIGADDPLYGPYSIRCHEFKRTLIGLRPGCTLGPRTQLNTITSYLDASFVYGSSRSMNANLRHDRRGLLRMWNYFPQQGLKPLLPPQEENPDEECVGRRGRYCFLSGDGRTNQQIQLVALHTIHTRQHNRLALALNQLNPHWTGDRIYHEARHIHIAILQHIILTEYLPSLLGPHLCYVYNLTESAPGTYWDGYDPSINPGISQAFAAAAFRQGHSTVPSEVYRFSPNHDLLQVQQLRQFFRQPYALYEPGAMDEFLLGMVDAPAQSVDPFVSADLSGHLLQMPKEPIGLDLVSINIQRGRDQGVAGYNAFRQWCGLPRVGSFEELKAFMSNRSAELMALLYESPDDIDLFTGGTSEFPAEGAQVGPTFACIIGRQFESLRRGDRFWFELSMGPQAFTLAQLESIKQVTLARLMCANSDNIVTIQRMALKQAHPILNPRQLCATLPDLDLGLWFEPPAPLQVMPGAG